MPEILCTRRDGCLVPLDDETREWLRRAKVDDVIRCDAKIMRNGRFFRKWWVLVGLLFEVWSSRMPTIQYHGMSVKASKEAFRRDITIKAGYYEQVFNLDGTFRVEPASISYAKMQEPEFERLYSSTINVGLEIVGEAYTGAQLDEWVDRIILGFD